MQKIRKQFISLYSFLIKDIKNKCIKIKHITIIIRATKLLYSTILPTPSKAFVSFNPTFKALYFYFTDIVSDHTVADIDTDMAVLAA